MKRNSSSFPQKLDRRFLWIGLGLLSLLIRWIFSMNPYFTEVLYSRGIFAIIRWAYDYTLGWIPFPILYLFVPVLLSWIVWKIRIYRKRYQGRTWLQQTAAWILHLLAFGGGVVCFFFFLWGYNYSRLPLEEQMDLSVGSLDAASIKAEFFLATKEAVEARDTIPNITDSAMVAAFFPHPLESHMRKSLEEVLDTIGSGSPGRVRGRRLWPKGLLMQLGATGIYIPFVAEGHIDAGLHPVSQPFTLAHELGHGYGFGDEGTCNFLGYLACEQSSDPAIQYAGKLSYWREVAGLYRKLSPKAYKEHRAALPAGMLADIEAINAAYRKYPGFFPDFSRSTYNSYLKSQGISEGTVNYSRVVAMVAAWRRRIPKK
ncbi:MAG: DUF3810 domain-containing protein [Bacteroidota bacterium]